MQLRTINERNGGSQGSKIDNMIGMGSKAKDDSPKYTTTSSEEKSKEEEKEVVMELNKVTELVENFVLNSQQKQQSKGTLAGIFPGANSNSL